MSFPCGTCIPCKQRRVNGWAFRLQKELERSSSALFITLTYDNEHVPITKNGFMNLNKKHVQDFFKRFRKRQKEKIKYYLAAEYGGKTKRPHYHIILFNADKKFIDEDLKLTWLNGEHHIGEVNQGSIIYTLKYIDKGKTIPQHKNDDRQPEFSLMSKKMGDNYLTPQMVKWHKKDLENRYYLPQKDGYKIALPRYYKDKIYTSMQKQKIGTLLQQKEQDINKKKNLSTIFAEMEKEDLIRMHKLRKNNDDNRKTSL